MGCNRVTNVRGLRYGLGSEAGGWGCVAISLVSLHKHLRETSAGLTRSMKEFNSPGGEIEGFQRLSMCLYHVQIYVGCSYNMCKWPTGRQETMILQRSLRKERDKSQDH